MANNPLSYRDPDGDFIIGALINGIRGATGGDGFFNGVGQYFENRIAITEGLFSTDENKTPLGRVGELISRFTFQATTTVVGQIVANTFNTIGAVNEVNNRFGVTVLDTDFTTGAVSIGNVISGPPGFRPDFRDHLFVHEYGHYIQSQRLGNLYLSVVGLPSFTDIIGWPGRHDTRWYEASASRLGADYFDNSFGTGRNDYVPNSPNHFDRNSFINRGVRSPYANPRGGNNAAGMGNFGGNPINSQFHWSDIPINTLYNGGLGLFGFWP